MGHNDVDERRRLSRHRFLRTVAIGGAAGTTFLTTNALTAKPAAALPPPCDIDPIFVPRTVTDSSRKVLGGVVVSYVPAPLNARGTIRWSITNTRTTAIRLSSAVNASVSVKAEPSLPPLTAGGVSVGTSSTTLRQRVSGQVSSALAVRFTESQGIETSAPGGGLATVDDTAFLLLGRPTVLVKVLGTEWIATPRQPCRGDPGPGFGPDWSNEATFQFLDGGTIMPRTVRELRNDAATRGFIGARTVDNILATYPLLQNPSGQALGLGAPRFTFVRSISPGAPPFTFSESVTVDRSSSVSASLSVNSEVTTTTQFRFGQNAQKFSDTVGVGVTITGTQADSVATTTTSSGTLTSDQNRLNFIYRDNVFNTLLITDEGPLSAAPLALAGTVTGADGRPVAGAVVTLQAPGGGGEHMVVADERGRYQVRVPGGLAAGTYRVVAGGRARTVRLGGRGPARLDLAKVRAPAATGGPGPR